jgi:DNA-binding NarL/FixJ family response regulator
MFQRKTELNARDIAWLELIAEGMSHKEIAAECGLSSHTVSAAMPRIYALLGADNGYQAIAMAFRRGILK